MVIGRAVGFSSKMVGYEGKMGCFWQIVAVKFERSERFLSISTSCEDWVRSRQDFRSDISLEVRSCSDQSDWD